ncbi:hypothetical protein MNBD_GAMMA21-966 [hydrothermal vent metagenome]|uniref:Thioredoxin domain-containing protein n=1 Tax=hydrothermal vent metagenome TaxID=652676 RepID=A0A3B0ZNU4_9ZZZZ
MSPALILSLETFNAQVLDASHEKLVLVDFWADWCSPCLVIAPILDKVLSEYANEVVYSKLEVDEGENMKLAGRYKVRGFPTIMLFRDGEELDRFSGARPAQFIEQFLQSNLNR